MQKIFFTLIIYSSPFLITSSNSTTRMSTQAQSQQPTSDLEIMTNLLKEQRKESAKQQPSPKQLFKKITAQTPINFVEEHVNSLQERLENKINHVNKLIRVYNEQNLNIPSFKNDIATLKALYSDITSRIEILKQFLYDWHNSISSNTQYAIDHAIKQINEHSPIVHEEIEKFNKKFSEIEPMIDLTAKPQNIEESKPITQSQQPIEPILPAPLEQEPSYTSALATWMSNKIFGQNIGKDYWYFYNLEEKLSQFNTLSDRTEKEAFLTKIIQNIHDNYLIAEELLLDKYYKKEDGLISKITKYIPAKIIANPSQANLHVSNASNKITQFFKQEKQSSATILPVKTDYQKRLSPTAIKNIEYLWLSNLKINTIDQFQFFDPLASDFNIVVMSLKQKVEQVEYIHNQIHTAYLADLDALNIKYTTIIKFTIEKFQDDSDIKHILYDINPPFITMIILKTDSAQNVFEITNTFEKLTRKAKTKEFFKWLQPIKLSHFLTK